VSAKRAIFVAPFDDLADPRVVARLAAEAEAAGFDGFFVWDHENYSAPTTAVGDPWIALSAIACATERVTIGPLVTPLPRRRVHKLARETAALDILSGGRLVLGVGIGGDKHGEFGPFGDSQDPRERADLLDQGLDKLMSYWGGEFEPRPLQRPRIPVWVAARWPNKRPMRRAARWDGLFPIDQTEPEQLAEMVAYVKEHRPPDAGPFEIVVVDEDAGVNRGPWEEAGATWFLTGFGSTPTEAAVRAAIAAGPG
jgi:alkanesulfonate monooxygenase SsuD/methylene tetrahydromethanopterin reductase-like flavin-dependent oxidoreductase (luciferase family)